MHPMRSLGIVISVVEGAPDAMGAEAAGGWRTGLLAARLARATRTTKGRRDEASEQFLPRIALSRSSLIGSGRRAHRLGQLLECVARDETHTQATEHIKCSVRQCRADEEKATAERVSRRIVVVLERRLCR